MKKYVYLLLCILVLFCLTAASCQSENTVSAGQKSIVVTYSVLGSLVKDLVGEKAVVSVSIPNGLDPHEWEPSAKDIEILNNADLIICNGLEFESGMLKTIDKAKNNGVKVFTASDHIQVRHIGEGEIIEEDHENEAGGEPEETHEHHHEVGSPDPHLWTDPVTMKSIIQALAEYLKQALDIDVSSRAQEIENRLDNLDQEINGILSTIPQDRRKLVTGHSSMGYFAQRYGFQVIGAIIPSISTQAEVSASGLAGLKRQIEESRVAVIFTELGTNPAVAETIGKETGARVVQITTHVLPEDGSYFTMMRTLAKDLAEALKQ